MANKSEFALTWSEFNSSISSGFHDSLIRGDLVDVTLAAEGQLIKAHRLVLSVCSPYFRRMLTTMPENQHAFIFLMDVKHSMLKDLITFMYCGEVNVKMESLTSFMSLAQQLEIKGLTSRSIQKVPKKIPTATTTTATTLPPLIKCAAVPQESYNPTESKPLQNIQPMKQPAPVSQPTSFYTVKNETGNNPSEFEEYAISIKSEPEDYDENAMSISMDNNPIQIHPGPVEEPVENNNYSLYNTYGQGTSSTNRVVYTSQMQERGFVSSPVKKSYLTLPDKSKFIYDVVYSKFEKWRLESNFTETTEDVLLAYFQSELDDKKSSTQWSTFSMLKSTLMINESINIQEYSRLLSYLKQKGQGYIAKKSRVFTKLQIAQFLSEADDEKFLQVKVALIVGVFGGCRREELIRLNASHVEENQRNIIITIPDATRTTFRTFVITDGIIPNVSVVELFKKYSSMRPIHMRRFFVGFRNGRCIAQPVGINSMGDYPKRIAAFLNLPCPELYTGHCFRRSAIALNTSRGIKPFE